MNLDLIEVLVPVPLMGRFSYLPPKKTDFPLKKGSRVLVPFGKRQLVGVIWGLTEKEESDKNYSDLLKQHQQLKLELEKIQKGVSGKFGGKDHINEKIDELNQETESLIDEIEKWQT